MKRILKNEVICDGRIKRVLKNFAQQNNLTLTELFWMFTSIGLKTPAVIIRIREDSNEEFIWRNSEFSAVMKLTKDTISYVEGIEETKKVYEIKSHGRVILVAREKTDGISKVLTDYKSELNKVHKTAILKDNHTALIIILEGTNAQMIEQKKSEDLDAYLNSLSRNDMLILQNVVNKVFKILEITEEKMKEFEEIYFNLSIFSQNAIEFKMQEGKVITIALVGENLIYQLYQNHNWKCLDKDFNMIAKKQKNAENFFCENVAIKAGFRCFKDVENIVENWFKIIEF